MNAPSRRGPFRRLLATIAQRCSTFGDALLPTRAPRDAAHWEPEDDARPLPEVELPRVAPAAVAQPAADQHAIARSNA
jgi:hypothetical protein